MAQATTQAATIDWSSANDDQVLDADLIVALNLERLSDDEKAGFLAKMAETVQKAVIARALQAMTEDQRKQVDELIKKDNPDALADFITKTVANFDDLVRQETLVFKRTMLTGRLPASA